MRNANSKSSDNVLVEDAAAAMQKTILATRSALAVPKAKIDAMTEKGKAGKAKRK